MESITINPIGQVCSDLKYRYETPRQGVLAGSGVSVIKLNKGCNFEQALTELSGFERIWIIYKFHLNDNWKPLVMPPRHRRRKVGVFATRAPYRPNGIGLSCVKLLEIRGLDIYITESDILDGSPVLDIKPYLPYSDSFPDSATGWAQGNLENYFVIQFSQTAEVQTAWLKENASINLRNFIRLQLEFAPDDDSRKRVIHLEEKTYELAYRTWRIRYTADRDKLEVFIQSVYSGYSEDELNDMENDRYEDKQLHKMFCRKFYTEV